LPFTKFLERLKFPRTLATFIAIILGLVFIGSIVYFLYFQITSFIKDVPTIKKNLADHYVTIQNWAEQKLHISTERQSVLINNATTEVKNAGSSYIDKTFLTISQAILLCVLVTFYTFFIIYYRDIIKRFFFSVFGKSNTSKVNDV